MHVDFYTIYVDGKVLVKPCVVTFFYLPNIMPIIHIYNTGVYRMYRCISDSRRSNCFVSESFRFMFIPVVDYRVLPVFLCAICNCDEMNAKPNAQITVLC